MSGKFGFQDNVAEEGTLQMGSETFLNKGGKEGGGRAVRSSASIVNLLPLQRAALFLSAYWAGLPACLEQEWGRG